MNSQPTKRFYLTTAIDYINSRPHIGQAYEKVLADTMARFQRALGVRTRFLTGTDEHSINIFRKAREQGLEPKVFCDQMAKHFQEMCTQIGVTHDRFIRTTDADHVETVQELIRRIHKNGYLTTGTYEGWYCPSCEAFYAEEDLADGKCKIHDSIEVEWIKEKNFFFKLSAFQQKLEQLLREQPAFVEPEIRRNEVLGKLRSGLQDISVSRSSLEWGVPFPPEICAEHQVDRQVVYVWFDALINYATGVDVFKGNDLSDLWPADVHIIGKDIIFFHCIIWPAMLMAADLPVPKQVFAHGFWLSEGKKMSKTAGNVVDPIEIIEQYGSDAFRFYLLSECYPGNDGNFSRTALNSRYTDLLANDLGNLLQRTISMVAKYLDCKTPALNSKVLTTQDQSLIALFSKTFDAYIPQMHSFYFNEAIRTAWTMIKQLNKYIADRQPWALAKAEDKTELHNVLRITLEGIYLSGVLTLPILPEAASRIFEQLGVSLPNNPLIAYQFPRLLEGHVVQKAEPLFPKLELDA